jgi:NDP-sugar pyrophosphorylase family protein
MGIVTCSGPTPIRYEVDPMKAIIMAGGKGSRLYPYSAVLPKPLMPLGETPVLEVLLRKLRREGIDGAILAVNHMRHLIEAYFGDGSRFGMPIEYSREEMPLGTAGPMGAVLDKLGDEFVLANGDLLTTLDVARMIAAHRETKADATIGVYEREVKVEFGLIDVDASMRMTGYREKPSQHHLVSMGIYVLRTAAVRAFVLPNRYLDMPNLVTQMMETGGSVMCHRQDCVWLDIGRPDDFSMAQQMIERTPEQFLPPAE